MIALILAMDRNQVIGKAGRIPWRLPTDLAYFKQLTLGHPVIMGRKTYESIGKPLPGRQNIIMSTNTDYQVKGCKVLHSITEVRRFCDAKDVFVIGGSQIYREFLPIADRLYITLLDEVFTGDSYFPQLDQKQWQLISKSQGQRNEKNPYDYSFLIYGRI
ncbi:MAG TPA: dihydrofolate reductase [Firmicutes bacterium]|nr:dihydrofolate reductase [Bacillota bacterium]